MATSTDRGGGAAVAPALLAVLAVLPFAPSLAHPFFADDYLHLERARALGGPPWPGILGAWVLRAGDSAVWWSPPDLAIAYFRPLVALSFVADLALWGLTAWGFHLTNLLLHAGTTLVVHAIARRVLGSPRGAFAAAALFALHPSHTEAVVWISARTDLLAGAAGAAAFLFYLKTRERAEGRAAPLALTLLALAVALLSKEVAAAVPLLLVLHALLVPAGEPLGRRLVPPLLSAGVVAAYLALRVSVLGGSPLPPHPFAHAPGDPDLPAHALMAPLLYLADLTLFVPPDPVVTFPFWRAHPLAFAALAALAVLALLSSVRRVADRRLRWLGLGWMAATLLPVAPLSMGERFLYLPSIGYCLLIGAGAETLLARDGAAARRRMVAVAALVGVVALARTVAFGVLAGRARGAIEEAVAALQAAPERSLALVVDLPASAALGFAHALRLERPPGLEVEVLSLTPVFLVEDGTPPSNVTVTRNGLAVSRPVPYLRTYIERAFLGERVPFAEGDVVARPSLTVTVGETADDGVTAFGVRLRPEALRRALLLRGHEFHFQADPAWSP